MVAANHHPCPGGCGCRVQNSRYACQPCWQRLPRELQQAVMNVAHAPAGERARVLATVDAHLFELVAS